MHVSRFTDEYDELAALLDVPPNGLRLADGRFEHGVDRWIAHDGGAIVASVRTFTRPDGRTFLMFEGGRLSALPTLAEAAVDVPGSTLWAMVDDEDTERSSAFASAGFAIAYTFDRFDVRFDTALARLRRAWVPTGYAIHPVSEIDVDRAFALDNAIRSFVPGTEGWEGNREWFVDELASEEFAADAYLVAVHEPSEQPVGLIRIWRNPDGPRLGLIGVLPEHRRPSLAAALLNTALTPASGWGYPSFTTETSTANRDVHPGLTRIGADVTGRFHQLVRHYG